MRKRKLGLENAIDLTLSSGDDESVEGAATIYTKKKQVKKPEESVTALLVKSSSSDDNEEDDRKLESDADVHFVSEVIKPSSSSTKRSVKKKKNTARAEETAAKSINEVLRDKQRSGRLVESGMNNGNNAIYTSTSSISQQKNLPPLLLSTPAAIEKHTPCYLQTDILPPDLAARLYRAMLAESTTWERNKWYLADKLVESSHKTSFYTSSSADAPRTDVQWYMGRKQDETPRLFVEEMEEARSIIEEFVNAWLSGKGTKRFGLEYDGPWRANVAASNCYRGGAETVGYHADQLTYLGPYPTIASLSLGTTRIFRLRGVASLQESKGAPPPRTYDIQLPHNSLCIMGAGCQERFKHTIPPARSIDIFKLKNGDRVETFIERINITFRFYRPDFQAKHTPICHCGIPTVLKADAKGKAAAHATEPGEDVDQKMRFFWMCFAGAQNEGKKCNFFKILDVKGGKRGPCIGDSLSEDA